MSTSKIEAVPAVSVLVPVGNDAGPPGELAALYREVEEALGDRYPYFEFLPLVEPGGRAAVAGLEEIAGDGEPVRPVEASGPSALRRGEREARGELLLILPPAPRVTAGALPELLRTVEEGEADLAAARRWPRRDSWVERARTRVLDAFLEHVTGRGIRDTACGVWATGTEVLRRTPLHGVVASFLPHFAAAGGFRVEEIGCEQHPRDTDARVPRFGGSWSRFVDVLKLFLRLRLAGRPQRPAGLARRAGRATRP